METCRPDKPTINIFEILNLRKEPYHNAMLAWLLDPEQSHGLDDAFLSCFLERVRVENRTRDDFQEIRPEYTFSATDGSATRRPDIFIETRNHKIYIENKVSRGSINDQQLKDQARYIGEDAGDKAAVHVLIVPRRRDIRSSTQAIVDENDIRTLEWSELVKLLEDIASKDDADPHVRVILEQYLSYVKEVIVYIFDGFDIEEMQKYVEAAEVIWRFKKGESPTKRQIEGFLTIVAEEVLSRLSGIGSGGWDFQIKQYGWAAVWWGIYFTSEHYPNIEFYIEIYYAPQWGSSGGLLNTMVGVTLYGERLPQLKEVIHAESSRFVGQDTENYATSNTYKCAEYFDEVQWSDLERWQSFRDRLVDRAVAWMTALIPVVEKTLQPLQEKQRAKKRSTAPR
jgi:hypothetical protein